MKVKKQDLRDAIELAVEYECTSTDCIIYRATSIITNFISNDKDEIENFKKLVVSYLTKDTNIEVI